MIDDGVDRHRSFTCLAITNDQLSLAAANRHHRIDRFQTRLQWLRYGLTRNNTWRNFFDRGAQLGVDRAFAVNRLTERVHYATTQLWADRHLKDAACALDGVAFGDMFVSTENNGAHRIALKVQRKAVGVAREFQHLALHRIGEAMNTADTIGDRNHSALVANLGTRAESLDPALDQLADFRRVELHVSS